MMRVFLLVLAFMSTIAATFAQSSDARTHYTEVDVRPAPYVGFTQLAERMTYPELARRAGIEGVVQVVFTVDEHGLVVATGDSDTAIGPICYQDPGGGTCEQSLKAVRSAVLAPGFVGDQSVAVEECFVFDFRLPDGKGTPDVATKITALHCE